MEHTMRKKHKKLDCTKFAEGQKQDFPGNFNLWFSISVSPVLRVTGVSRDWTRSVSGPRSLLDGSEIRQDHVNKAIPWTSCLGNIGRQTLPKRDGGEGWNLNMAPHQATKFKPAAVLLWSYNPEHCTTRLPRMTLPKWHIKLVHFMFSHLQHLKLGFSTKFCLLSRKTIYKNNHRSSL